MSRNTKLFHPADVITALTYKMVTPGGWDALYALLRHLCGEPVYTHQILRVLRECQPVLQQRYPQLADALGDDFMNRDAWLARIEAAHGTSIEVEPLPAQTVESIEPVSELAQAVHPDRIATVHLCGDPSDE